METGTETRQALASKTFWLTGFSFLSPLICLLLCNWRSLVKENGPLSSWGPSAISLLSVWLHCVYLGSINTAPIFLPSAFPYTQDCQARNDATFSLQWILHGDLRFFCYVFWIWISQTLGSFNCEPAIGLCSLMDSLYSLHPNGVNTCGLLGSPLSTRKVVKGSCHLWEEAGCSWTQDLGCFLWQ